MAPQSENSIKTRFQKGQSGNPAGRPKGSLTRKSVIRKWLEAEENVTNPITGVKEQLNQIDLIVLAAIKEARKGNVQAFKELLDSGFGKVEDKVDATHTINDSNAIRDAFLESLKK